MAEIQKPKDISDESSLLDLARGLFPGSKPESVEEEIRKLTFIETVGSYRKATTDTLDKCKLAPYVCQVLDEATGRNATGFSAEKASTKQTEMLVELTREFKMLRQDALTRAAVGSTELSSGGSAAGTFSAADFGEMIQLVLKPSQTFFGGPSDVTTEIKPGFTFRKGDRESTMYSGIVKYLESLTSNIKVDDKRACILTHTKKILDRRKPDITVYVKGLTYCVLTIAFCLEVKVPSEDYRTDYVYTRTAFPLAEVGQAVDYALRILRKNPLRNYVYVALTDSQIIQAYKVNRQILDGEHWEVEATNIELCQTSTILARLLSMSDDELGVVIDYPAFRDMELRSVLGVGSSGRVYEAKLGGQQVVLKAYENERDCKQENEMLQDLAMLAKHHPEVRVPRVLESTSEFKQLVMQPVGIAIGSRSLFPLEFVLRLIFTVTKLHEAGIAHCDIRPDNLVMYLPSGQVWQPRARSGVDEVADLLAKLELSVPTRASAAAVTEDRVQTRSRLLLAAVPASPKKVPKKAPKKKAQPKPTLATAADANEPGLYLIDYAYAEKFTDGRVTMPRHRGTVKFASDDVLAQLRKSAGSVIQYRPIDEWHSVVRTLYALSHPLMWLHLARLSRSDYAGIRQAWQTCLQGDWDVSQCTDVAQIRKQAAKLAHLSFADFEAVST
eukprot:TRINITY_DN4909_c0_g2_i1.p1 TRINITY_DN4909_c0_g2~~TRINITY_DN4909_c0_g2_i1.p1  ORF type:complete len:670 (+),score=59.41 TRINITY_DN4909_c0_g2_i1:156-2165(+)